MASKVIDEKFAAIVDAVCYWMGYQFKIGRDLFLEILKAKGIEARIIGEPVMEVRPSFKMSAVLNNLIYILPIIFIVTSIAFIYNKS